LRIVPADPGKPAATFSGGNQQKVLFARAIAAATPVLILDQPTAGVDVGAKADLYEQIDHLARSGISIILISDDLDELLALCDRVAVVRKGQLEAVRPADDFDRAELLRAITLGAPAAVPVAT
jgi:ABC-type sugar transport system ATPase subunit